MTAGCGGCRPDPSPRCRVTSTRWTPPVTGAADVYTRCNIGEMMPGAFCPLTASVSGGHAIDYAMQMTQVVARAQERYDMPWRQVGYFYGHMFLNMTEGGRV